MTNKELEKLLQDKFAEQSYSYNPEAWDKMASMLDAQPTPQSGYWFKRTAIWVGLAATSLFAHFDSPQYTESYAYSDSFIEESAPRDQEPNTPVVSKAPTTAIAATTKEESEEPYTATPTTFSENQIREDQAYVSLSSKEDLTVYEGASNNNQILAFEEEEETDLNGWSDGKKERFKLNPQIYLTGGLNLATTWEGNTDIENGVIPNFFVGLEAKQLLKKQWFVKTGLTYFQRGGLNTQVETITTSFDFGFQETRDLTTTRLAHYLEVPILIGKQHKGLNFYGGIKLNFLLAVNDHIDRTTTTDFSTTQESFDILTQNRTFNNLDIAIVAGIDIFVTSKIGLTASTSYGFVDQTNNQQTGSTSADKNLLIRAGVLYKLF